jgi:hypothetical protein
MRVTESMGPAWERMKQALFRPFNLGTWFSFGLLFALESCIEGGGSNFNVPNPGDLGGGGSDFGEGYDDYDDDGYDTDGRIGSALRRVGGALAHAGPSPSFDTGLIAGIVIAAVLIAIPLVLLLYWLGCRGQMAAIRGVAAGSVSSVGEAWSATAAAGNALFKFHLALAGIALVVFLPLLGFAALTAYPVFDSGERIESVLPVLLLLGAVALVFIVPFVLVRAMTRSFVAPIMLLHGVGAREAWRRFWAHGRAHVGAIVLYFLLRVVVGIGAGIVGVVAGLVTCCLGFLPILHQTLMAPYYVFERAWSLEVLASLSPDFDLRSAPTPAAPPYPYGGGYGPPGAGYGGGAPHENPYAPPGFGPPAGGFGGGGPHGGG